MKFLITRGLLSAAGGGDTTKPTAPVQGVPANVTNTSADITLTTPSTDDVAVVGYNVYRGALKVASLIAQGAFPFTDNGLSPGQTYAFTITGQDAAGNESDPSNVRMVTTTGGATGGFPALFDNRWWKRRRRH